MSYMLFLYLADYLKDNYFQYFPNAKTVNHNKPLQWHFELERQNLSIS